MTNFTPEDLLLYIFKETSAKKTLAINNALKEDWTLREKLAVLKISLERLDGITKAPRARIVTNVLDYARKTKKVAVK